ncbi:serine/threonine-protein kinase pim-2-like [Chanodichthys erythropterus]|uniref:serine/threonine-protein kinase pim-2-like n=1 Tax=Chanodichthys erythropterus TaxID=933992 RepID=UPI00351E2A71
MPNCTQCSRRFEEDYEEFKVLPWPPSSPNLNPIEHQWDVLDQQVQSTADSPHNPQVLKDLLPDTTGHLHGSCKVHALAGQTFQDIISDHEVLPTAEEPITGDPEVNNEWSQDPLLSFLDSYSRLIPLEVALHMYANQGPRVPQIVELLDWKDEDDHYIMVLERPVPCQPLYEFLQSYTSTMDEKLARIIMGEVAFAAQICCQRGVLHRDIKPENLLINPDTLEVKLVDFGCGDFLTSAGYTSFAGTKAYCPPKYEMYGVYHGEPATVWSLGILLFLILFWQFPSRRDLRMISKNIWENDGLSQECCDFIRCCLQRNPRKRIELEKIGLQDWFNVRTCPLQAGSEPGPVYVRYTHPPKPHSHPGHGTNVAPPVHTCLLQAGREPGPVHMGIGRSNEEAKGCNL